MGPAAHSWRCRRPVRGRPRDRPRRLRGGVRGPRPGAVAPGRAQGSPGPARRDRGAWAGRGGGRRAARPPQHRAPLRRRALRAGRLPHHGAPAGRDAGRAAGEGTAPPAAGGGDCGRDRPRPRPCAPAGRRPPGPQAGQRLPVRGRPGEGARLRPGPGLRPGGGGGRHCGLHGPGAGAWRGRGRTIGRVQPGRDDPGAPDRAPRRWRAGVRAGGAPARAPAAHRGDEERRPHRPPDERGRGPPAPPPRPARARAAAVAPGGVGAGSRGGARRRRLRPPDPAAPAGPTHRGHGRHGERDRRAGPRRRLRAPPGGPRRIAARLAAAAFGARELAARAGAGGPACAAPGRGAAGDGRWSGAAPGPAHGATGRAGVRGIAPARRSRGRPGPTRGWRAGGGQGLLAGRARPAGGPGAEGAGGAGGAGAEGAGGPRRHRAGEARGPRRLCRGTAARVGWVARRGAGRLPEGPPGGSRVPAPPRGVAGALLERPAPGGDLRQRHLNPGDGRELRPPPARAGQAPGHRTALRGVLRRSRGGRVADGARRRGRAGHAGSPRRPPLPAPRRRGPPLGPRGRHHGAPVHGARSLHLLPDPRQRHHAPAVPAAARRGARAREALGGGAADGEGLALAVGGAQAAGGTRRGARRGTAQLDPAWWGLQRRRVRRRR